MSIACYGEEAGWPTFLRFGFVFILDLHFPVYSSKLYCAIMEKFVWCTELADVEEKNNSMQHCVQGISTTTTHEKMKGLSAKANSVATRCARALCTTVEDLRRQFELEKPDSATGDYARNFVEFCCFKMLSSASPHINQLSDRSFTCLTFDMMLAWQSPSATADKEEDEERSECLAKEKQEMSSEIAAKIDDEESSLFYSDLMPLLVDVESSVGVDAFARLAPAVPLVADVVTVNFLFETLTASTGGRLPFPLYDKYVKELDKSINGMKKQSMPTLNLAKREIVLHVDGSGATQRVVRHIGGTSWPGRLTLTNYALYFETSGAITYEKPIKFDLSANSQQQVKAGSTGPWGAPLFDKAVIYESSDMKEPLILEFPELTSSARRDYWLALMKEVVTVHKFIRMFGLEGREEKEAIARSVAGVVRLHATRESFQIFPPCPQTLLTFTLSEELLPGGDFVLEELANSIRTGRNQRDAHLCSSGLLLHSFGVLDCKEFTIEEKETICIGKSQVGELTPLETTVQQSTQEAKKTETARASVESFREEGITENGKILKEIVSPLIMITVPWFQELLAWKKPLTTTLVFFISLVVTYTESVRYVVSALFFMATGFLIWIRRQPAIQDKYEEIVVSKSSSDQTTMESIVSAQQAIAQLHSALQTTNITLLKLLSIALSKPIEHTNQVIVGLTLVAITLLIVPLRVIIMGIIVDIFTMNLRVRQSRSSERSSRRLKEWWDSVPAIPVRMVE